MSVSIQQARHCDNIAVLSLDEISHVNGGGDKEGEAVAGIAAGIATLAPLTGAGAPVVLAVAATTLLVAFVVEATEQK